jgi:hypothetical protein
VLVKLEVLIHKNKSCMQIVTWKITRSLGDILVIRYRESVLRKVKYDQLSRNELVLNSV